MIEFRVASSANLSSMRSLLQEVAESGDTIPASTSASQGAMLAEWFGKGVKAYVALQREDVVGMYKLGANKPDRGSHVATATFLVRATHRRMGLGAALLEHCLMEAAASGFVSIQFNFVVSANAPALSLYKRFGFSIVGTLPSAFRHRTLGYVDAHVMFKAIRPIGD